MSHLDLDNIEIAMKHNIIVIKLPPNLTSILQPLDRTFFGPLKKIWSALVKSRPLSSVDTIRNGEVVILLKDLFEQIKDHTSQWLKSGFASAGIHPFNPNKVAAELEISQKNPILNQIKIHKKSPEVLRDLNILHNSSQQNIDKHLIDQVIHIINPQQITTEVTPIPCTIL